MTSTGKMLLALGVAAAWCGALAQGGRAQESGRAPSTAIAESAEHSQPVLYQKGSDLQQTLLATRQRYAAWLAEQPTVRKAVELGAWLATPPLPADQAEKLSGRAKTLTRPPNCRTAERFGRHRKTCRTAERSSTSRVPAERRSICWRTIRTAQPAKLTVGIGGGEHLDVWLNGRLIASARRI